MQQVGDVRAVEAALGDQRGEPVDDRLRVVLDGGGDLLGEPLAALAEEDDVGERPADIDADAELGHLLGRARA